MKPTLTIISKAVIYLMFLSVLIVCGILFPELAREESIANPNAGPAYPFLIVTWVLSTPIFVSLYQALKLINLIDKNKAFTKKSVKYLKNIKIALLVFAVLIITGAITTIVFVRKSDPREDVTPIITIGFIMVFVSGTIAMFVSVLQRLLEQAINIKSENDLTV